MLQEEFIMFDAFRKCLKRFFLCKVFIKNRYKEKKNKMIDTKEIEPGVHNSVKEIWAFYEIFTSKQNNGSCSFSYKAYKIKFKYECSDDNKIIFHCNAE